MTATATLTQQRLGRYELLARVASGGMGEIFLARLEGAAGFEKLYVVKRILPHLADDPRFRQMLISEARIASKLNHANICQVYELGETDGQLYIVMEYLEGLTLLPVLRRASRDAMPLDLGFIGGMIQQTADALHYAHELRDRDGSVLGIVHRDVTPGNLFLTDAGVVKVLDFGIAKAKGASASHTQTGAVKGKYAYMAPEQLRGGEIDRRVDVFALGIALFEMLALRRLFQRKTDYLTFRAVMEQPIADVRHYRPDTPGELAAVVARALDREPANRYDSARLLATAALDAIAASGRRPWSQSELGDYVRNTFRQDLGKRSEEVASAISKTQPGVAPSLLPSITSETSVEAFPEEEDTEFPPVETAVDFPPIQSVYATMTVTDTTPAPFGLDTTSSGSSIPLQPLPPALGPSPPRRGLLWPLVAFGMFAVAGGALVLVWQTSKQPPPTAVVISTSDSPRVDHDQDTVVVAPRDAAAAVPVPAADAAVVKPGGNPPPRPPPPRSNKSPYDRVIEARVPQLNQCAHDHPETAPPSAAQLHIDVGGHPTAVSLEPAALDGTPLGGCFKTVLRAARFPTAANEVDLTFPFHVKST